MNKYQDITKYKLLYDNVLIKGIKIDDIDGIIQPDSYEDKPQLGEVITVGTGRLLDSGATKELDVKVGDHVLFNQHSTTKFNLDGNDFYIVREEDVTGYIR